MNHRDLDTTEFKKLFDENSFVLIDVRTEDEFKLGHLKDAAHIDFYKDLPRRYSTGVSQPFDNKYLNLSLSDSL